MFSTFDDKEKQVDEASEARAASSLKIKKAIVVILVIFAVVLVAYFALLGIYNALTSPDNGDDPSETEKIYFYPIIPNEDIYSNEDYLGLMRDICYFNTDTGVTQSVAPEKYEDFGDGFVLMATMVESIIAGDSAAYNSCFSPKYYETNSPMGDFTPQKLYGSVSMGGILITKVNPSTIVGLEGENDKSVFYKLEYMIYQNNGTFRKDIGSDTNKPILFEVSEQEDGSFLIDRAMNIIQK